MTPRQWRPADEPARLQLRKLAKACLAYDAAVLAHANDPSKAADLVALYAKVLALARDAA